MSLNKGNADIIEQRRERVAYWRLRGKTQRDIVQLLVQEKIFNPETQEPFSLGTINEDCKAIRKVWRKEQSEAVTGIKGAILAELRAVRHAAWDGAGSPLVVAALIEALKDSNSDVRVEAAKALGRVGIPDLAAVLKSLKQEAELLGADAPTKFAPTTPSGKKPYFIEVKAIDYRTAIAPLAPGPVGNSGSPGEGQSAFDGEAMG